MAPENPVFGIPPKVRTPRRISDFMVQDDMEGEFEKTILHRALFPVNIRLYNTSQGYRDTITDIIHYMEDVLLWRDYEDYGRPKGISGANVGIPFNIIGIRKASRSDPDEEVTEFFINPVITARSALRESVKSNCGSLRLKTPIDVERHVWIDMEYYDEKGEKQKRIQIDKTQGGYTIQHEIDHNLGILITDRRP